MESQRRKSKILEVTFPKITNVKHAGMYIECKHENKSIKSFSSEYAPIGNVGKLTTLKNYTSAVDDLTHKLRQGFITMEKHFSEQWNNLEKQELIFRNKFIKYHNFIKYNMIKRERSIIKIGHYCELRNRRSEEICELKKNLNRLVQIKKTLDENIKLLLPYPKYVFEVVKIEPEFVNNTAVLRRFEVMEETRQYIYDLSLRNVKLLSDAKLAWAQLMESRRYVIVAMENTLSTLWNRREKARMTSASMETILLNVLFQCSLRFSELENVRGNCWDMYNRICNRRKGIPRVERKDTLKQLLCIKQNMRNIRQVADRFKKFDLIGADSMRAKAATSNMCLLKRQR